MSTHSEDSDGMGDSGYEILTDSTLMTDEEDDGASSVASIDDDDDHLDDNISSMVGSTDSLSSRPVDPEHDPHPIPSFGGLDEQHLDCSGMTMRERDSSPEEIVFNEPDDIFVDQVSVCHKLTDFGEIEVAEICRNLCLNAASPPTFYSTVRQTMCKDLLEMEEPFRVLYVGSTAAKDEIQHKLAAALAAAISESTSSSRSWDGVKSPRFNIIPISSFGSRSISPEVELVDSSGLDMTFDVCTAAKAAKHEGQPDTFSLWLNGNQNITSLYGEKGAQLDSPGWKLPHLTVVYCADDDNGQRRMTRIYARAFMARHSVPTLVISQNPHYHQPTEQYTLDARSVHLCIESDSPRQIHKSMPVDLSTFLNLNPRQLNRNLGCITGLALASRPKMPTLPTGKAQIESNPLLRDVEKAPQDTKVSGSLHWIREKKRDELFKLILVGWLFVCGLAGAVFGVAYMKFANIPESTFPSIPPIVAITTPSIQLSSMTLLLTSYSTPRVSVTSVSSVVPAVDFKNQLVDPKIMTLNSSDQFQAHIIGSSHVIIRPPQKFLLLRKPPVLFVRVTRNGAIINAELSTLFDGVYTLNIDEHDAWGVMNVSIWTKTKPIFKEDLEVDFGTPWVKVSRWMKVMEERRTELQTLIDQATTDAKEIASDLSQTAGHQAAEIGAVVLNKAKEYSGDVSDSLTKLYQDTVSFTLNLVPAKDGRYVRKAQQQAKLIWKREKRAC